MKDPVQRAKQTIEGAPTSGPQDVSRRRMLSRIAGAAGSTLVVGLVGEAAGEPTKTGALAPADPDAFPTVPTWTRQIGAPTGKGYGQPSPHESAVTRRLYPGLTQPITAYSTSPLQDLDGGITPNGLFFERHHAGVPAIDPGKHRLMIHGLVKEPLLLTVDDIRQFPSVSRIHFIECAGNPSFLPPWGKTAAEVAGLVSCAEWTGVSLRTLLEEVGLHPDAKWVIAEGADAAAMTRSIPLEKCLDDTLVVYSQNGERLRPEQGYPLRLVVPGFEGNMNIKWLRRLHVTNAPAYSREETAKYTDLMPDGRARKFSFVMECKSIITQPSGSHQLTRHGAHEIRGIAWSGMGKVERVDVSVDGGATWHKAELQSTVHAKALTAFRAPFPWNGEERVIMSRAIDETGYVQPTLSALEAARGKNSFYHNNAIQPWRIASDGNVTNGRE
nr:sulfite dehydrogenase [Panacagrimonas perspica]